MLWLPAQAQVFGPVPSTYASIKQNSVSNMAAIGDTLWIGPGLNRTIGNGDEWYFPEKAEKIVNEQARVFSIALAPDTIWAGLGYNASTPDGSVQAGMGYYYSTDGGGNWQYIEHPSEEESDTTFIYGGETYKKLPVTTQEQTPPFEIDTEGDTIFSANWALGILRSQDFGKTWERLILPPLQADRLVPENTYSFTGNSEERYDPRYDQNLLGFSVLVDNNGRVWCGTAGGLNISLNALSAPADSIKWEHIRADDSENGLMGNWIITIRQNPQNNDIWMTNWKGGLDDNEQFGVVRTTDGGKTFDHFLQGKRINDIGFKNGIIYAAGDDGLFASDNGGSNWKKISPIETDNNFIKESASFYSLASTTERLWVGTSDGLASTSNNGQSWDITRVNFPLDGSNQYQQDAPDVEAYAYPNPFSPRRHDNVRIKFEVKQAGSVTIRLFDYGMNLVKQIDAGNYSPGTYEAIWDGTSQTGNQIGNGVVLYQIKTPDATIRGKLLVID